MAEKEKRHPNDHDCRTAILEELAAKIGVLNRMKVGDKAGFFKAFFFAQGVLESGAPVATTFNHGYDNIMPLIIDALVPMMIDTFSIRKDESETAEEYLSEVGCGLALLGLAMSKKTSLAEIAEHFSVERKLSKPFDVVSRMEHYRTYFLNNLLSSEMDSVSTTKKPADHQH